MDETEKSLRDVVHELRISNINTKFVFQELIKTNNHLDANNDILSQILDVLEKLDPERYR